MAMTLEAQVTVHMSHIASPLYLPYQSPSVENNTDIFLHVTIIPNDRHLTFAGGHYIMCYNKAVTIGLWLYIAQTLSVFS